MRTARRVVFFVLFTSFWIDGNWYDRPIALIDASMMMINLAHLARVPGRNDESVRYGVSP